MNLLEQTDASLRRYRMALDALRRLPKSPPKDGLLPFLEQEDQRRAKDEYLHARQELERCVSDLKELVPLLEQDFENLDDMPLVTKMAKNRLDRAAGIAEKELEETCRMLEEAQNALGESESRIDPTGYPFPSVGSGEIWDRLRREIAEGQAAHDPGQESEPDPRLGSGPREPESLESLLGFRTELPREIGKD